MILLGIVGTPAAGKSTVAKTLCDWGADWINADLIARDCLNRPEILRQLAERFGDSIIDEFGQANRGRIADFVFGSDDESAAALEFLESVVHPQTRIEIRQRIIDAGQSRTPVAILDIPLLFESRWDLCCDEIWCIDADRQSRLDRAENRGWDSHELDRREANQLPIKTKMRLSNRVMQNDSTLDALRQNLRRAWDLLVKIKVGREGFVPNSGDHHCLSDWPVS